MLLNFGKCKCLHTGHGHLDVNYKMGDTVLGSTVKEKDLGITISADMKVSEQGGIRLVNKFMSTYLNAIISLDSQANANPNAIFQKRIQMQMFWGRIQMRIFWVHICKCI